ncbi:uncharacterized protein DUF3308 [Arcicella aurantiaca]|uniref:Uncharacterized protein DUF3308 n=1 Tax=Arcicella aurantiaca TaxID=591202 RepID=A0A316ECZ1_9BACT|nr:type IX secretion system membrane protein PorP/SprF [Arcicella aurantiaca]PWK28439.1 uncharacterized protein DUF3308 [Arcicella aurantiaca]
MKNHLLFALIIFVLFGYETLAQNYIFTPMALNPASTGSSDNLRISTNYGLVKGYQNTFLFTADAPVTKNGKLALGLQANVYASDERQNSFDEQKYFVGSIAYRIKIKGDNYLALGVQGMDIYNKTNGDYTPNSKINKTLRMGIGSNFYGKRGEIGISIPYFHEDSSPFNIHGNFVSDDLGKNSHLKISAVLYRPYQIYYGQSNQQSTFLDLGTTLYLKNLGIGIWANRISQGSLFSTFAVDYSFKDNLKLGLYFTPKTPYEVIQIHAKYDLKIYNREIKRRYF